MVNADVVYHEIRAVVSDEADTHIWREIRVEMRGLGDQFLFPFANSSLWELMTRCVMDDLKIWA